MTKPCGDMPPGTACSHTAAVIPRIRWGASCFICAVIAMRSGSGFPTPPARRCSLRIFGRTLRAITEKGRIYIPLEALAAYYGLTEDDIVERRFDARYVSLMKELVARTRQLFAEGNALARSVDSTLRVDIEMFSRGGLAVLDAIEAIGYNTLERRPSIAKSKQFSLLVRALGLRLLSLAQPSAPVFPQQPARRGSWPSLMAEKRILTQKKCGKGMETRSRSRMRSAGA